MARKQIADNNMTQTNGPLYDAPHDNPELIPNDMPTEAEKMREAAGVDPSLDNPNPTGLASHIRALGGSEPKRKAKRMVLDAELQAMAEINRILAGLDEETAERVVTWMNSRFGSEVDRRG